MKKIFYLSISLMLFLGACEPMDDVYEEINSENTVEGVAEYTLTSDDYETLELENENFVDEQQARDLIPGLLSDLYPYWGKGSSITVTYNLQYDQVASVGVFTSAEQYELTSTDYANSGSDAAGFYPGANVNDAIAEVLSTQIANSSEGEVVLATYNQYTEVPEIGYANLVEYNFQDSFEAWTVVDLLGDDLGWTSETNYIQGNGFDNGQVANLDYLVSPEIDLTEESDLKFQINQAINYATDLSLLKILVSTDYTDDFTTATWEEINLATAPAGDSNDFILSEEYDFSAYEGETINIALKYESTSTDAARWRVESLVIKTIGITGDSDAEGRFFMFDGSEWAPSEDVYYLRDADYDAMGAPGQYNNFSNSVAPEDYIPAFLSSEFPYAQEEDEMYIIYKYYDGENTVTRGSFYTYTNSVWEQFTSTLQFGHDGETWVPDNTIQYNLVVSDYDYVGANYADFVDDEGNNYSAAAGNLATYGNFNRGGGPTSWNDTMMNTVLIDLLSNVIAPNAEEGQKYVINANTYNSGNVIESFKYIKVEGEWEVNVD